MTEQLSDLLSRCRNGDYEACTTVVGRFRTWAHNLAWGILKDEHLAEDAVQASFLKAFDRLGDLRDPQAFPGWLRQIIRSEAIRMVRMRREKTLEDAAGRESGDLTPFDRIELNELRDLVRKALGSLPPAGRKTAELFYLAEQDCGQIARALRVPQGTVRRRLFDVRRKLRGVLQDYMNAQEAWSVERRA
jgi:RNA polymerase sigma factor (sigma-70 family)